MAVSDLVATATSLSDSTSRDFTITELVQAGKDKYTDSGVRFAWNARTQSSPRGFWDSPLKLRTVREDYPGSDIPSEQVLGPNYEPFTLEGIWDDRYAGVGFAQATWKTFEAMVQRGNLCRFQYGDVVMHGLITNFTAKFMQAASQGFYRIGYKFTVSPHFRKVGGDLRGARENKNPAPRARVSPNVFVDTADALRAQMQVLMAVAPQGQMVGTEYQDVLEIVSEVSDKVDAAQVIVEQRVLPLTGPNSVARLAQSFSTIATACADLTARLSAGRTDTDLAYEDAMGVLGWETWARQLTTTARALALQSTKAAADLSKRVEPEALALYRPQAGESLYAVSTRFYNTPHGWRAIYARNGLKAFTLTGLELLVIPKQH